MDVIGVAVSEVIVTAEKEGKRALYLGQSGALETIYVFRWNKLKPKLGQLIVKVYDKVQALIAYGEKPPFENAPVTRIEIERTRFGNKKFWLADLRSFKNPFEDIRVGFYLSAPFVGSAWDWTQYLMARTSAGSAASATIFKLSDEERANFERAYEAHVSDLLRPKETWPHWNAALELSGLSTLLKKAVSSE